jgi:MFS family permease
MLRIQQALGDSISMTELNESSRHYRGWRVVALCFVMAIFAWGFAFYGHGIYLPQLQRLHDWPTALVSAASTFCYLTSAIFVIFLRETISRLTLRWFLVGGAISLGLSIILLSEVSALWQLYAVYLVMAFGWSATSVAAISTLISMWFNKRRGLAISLALNGASFGGIVGVPSLLAAIDRFGFTTTLLMGGHGDDRYPCPNDAGLG